MSKINVQRLSKYINNIESMFYIETGTAEGDSLVHACKFFNYLYAIELSPFLYEKTKASIKNSFENINEKIEENVCVINFEYNKIKRQVNLILGNSKIELPKVLSSDKKRAVILLDAHYCKGHIHQHTARNEFPLWDELDSIKNRNKSDILVIDDVHTFGKKRLDLKDGGSEDSWVKVTKENLLNYMLKYVKSSETIGDQFVLYLKHCES